MTVLEKLDEIIEGIARLLELAEKKPEPKEEIDNPTLGDGIPADARFPATDEPEEKKIVWTYHEGKKFKTCKYKCGNYVSWDNNTKEYLHYDAGFKLIGKDCPKYGGNLDA